MPSLARRALANAVLVVVSVVFSALAAEALVRLVADDGMQFDLEMWKYARDVKVVADDPLMGHKHGPGRRARLMGVEFETNSKGLRDREFSRERTPGVKRIMMLGDSLTVGWGVPMEQTFSKRVEQLYRGRGESVEVINTGVGNYNTVQEVQFFLTEGKSYRPDIVVLNYFVNDAEPVPESRPPGWLLRKCSACVFALGRIDTLGRMFSAKQDWAEYYLGLYDNGRGQGLAGGAGGHRPARDLLQGERHQAAGGQPAGAARRAELSLPDGHGPGAAGSRRQWRGVRRRAAAPARAGFLEAVGDAAGPAPQRLRQRLHCLRPVRGIAAAVAAIARRLAPHRPSATRPVTSRRTAAWARARP